MHEQEIPHPNIIKYLRLRNGDTLNGRYVGIVNGQLVANQESRHFVVEGIKSYMHEGDEMSEGWLFDVCENKAIAKYISDDKYHE